MLKIMRNGYMCSAPFPSNTQIIPIYPLLELNLQQIYMWLAEHTDRLYILIHIWIPFKFLNINIKSMKIFIDVYNNLQRLYSSITLVK